MGKNPNAVQISWENSLSLDFRGTKGTPFLIFLHKANQLEPCILLVCPLGLKASRSCLALVVPRLESQERTEALLAVPAAGQHLVPESGCWLQIISQQSSFQIGRYWKNMWKVILITGFIHRFCGKIRKSTNIHLWSSNVARTSLIWGGVIGDHWTLQIKPSIDLTKPLYIIYHIIISWWLSDLAVRRPY